MRRLTKLEGLGHSVTIFPDAEEYIQQQLHREKRKVTGTKSDKVGGFR